jgi:hypothetical protein
MTYESPTTHRRTQAEMDDQALSWARADRSFFAAGACHVLAWTLLEARPGSGLRAVGLRRAGETDPFHVVVDDGTMAFDYAGWTARAELLAVIGEAVGAECPGTAVEELTLPSELEVFCTRHRHRLPEQFAGDVRARARAYLRVLGTDPRTHRWPGVAARPPRGASVDEPSRISRPP